MIEQSIHLIEQELNSLLSHMSKVIKVPPLQPGQKKRSMAAEGPIIRNETSIKLSAEEVLFKKWQVDLSMLNLRLPAYRPMPSGTIIVEPKHGIYFDDGNGELRFQLANEIHNAPTQHLQNLLTIVINDPTQILPFIINKIITNELEDRLKRGEEFIDIPPR